VRLVFDTNVLVAAVVASGVCRDLVEYCTEHHQLVTSDFILGELREKLDRKFKLTADVVEGVLTSFEARMHVVAPSPLDSPVCRDPDDDWVLATAVAGECECVVTGDRDLLDLAEYAGIRILRPRAFLDLESAPGS
jgi:putative PIN family toxin of toxin-antitoxin system